MTVTLIWGVWGLFFYEIKFFFLYIFFFVLLFFHMIVFIFSCVLAQMFNSDILFYIKQDERIELLITKIFRFFFFYLFIHYY
jgi:hypothetical protein